MTEQDKAEFLERVKLEMLLRYGTSWEEMEGKIKNEIDNTFDDEKFAKMDPEHCIDAAYARKEFGKKKPSVVDYMLWSTKFVTHSEYLDW